MASGKKKRSKELIILLIAMIVLIGSYIWMKSNKSKTGETPTEDITKEDVVIALDETKITSIYLKNEQGEMTLIKDSEGTWKYQEDENLPLHQTNANNMMNAFKSVTSSRTITEEIGDLSNFGLDNPTVTVIASLGDGTKTSIQLGDEVPITGGYYAKINETNEVYVVDGAFISKFKFSLADMTEKEDIPSITAENITHLVVEHKERGNFEIINDEDSDYNYSGLTSWILKQSYPINLPANTDEVNTLLGNFTSLNFIQCIEYNAKDLSKYGLDDPTARVSLEYFEIFTKEEDETDTIEANTEDTADEEDKESETTKVSYDLGLIFGTTDEDGNYYVRLKDSNSVHTMNADTAKKLIEIDAFTITDKYINLINIDSVEKVDLEFNGKTYTLSLERKKEVVDEKEKDVTIYYFNGKETEEDAFKDLYQVIISPKTERDLPKEYFDSNPDTTPYLKVTYHRNTEKDKTITIEYLPYDDSYYVVNSNGNIYFLTDMRKVNEIVEAVKNYK